MKKIIGLVLILNFSKVVFAAPAYNPMIIEVIKEMPSGGGYDTSEPTLKRLEPAIEFKKEGFAEVLIVNAEKASPSFCSGATYLVFVQLLSKLQQQKVLRLSAAAQKELLVRGQFDGSGVWGRWNANGPGTARLFYELGLGRNFTMEKLSEAQPGDFLKIFWTDEIGAKEHGHSVIFTGLREKGQGQELCFWSSNKAHEGQLQGGRGEKCVDIKKIRFGLFSRLENPERLNEAPIIMGMGFKAYSDDYLKSMLNRRTNSREVCLKVGCKF